MYEQGEIVIVPFPFSDLSTVKQRPVLILSKTADNKNSEEIITCGITSNLKNSNYSVFIYNENLERGKIPAPSRIKVNKLFTINKELIIKHVARLNKNSFNSVRKEFFEMI